MSARAKPSADVLSSAVAFAALTVVRSQIPRIARSAGDEIGMSKALGVVEYRDDGRRHAEQADLIKTGHLHRLGRIVGRLYRHYCQDLFRLCPAFHRPRMSRNR